MPINLTESGNINYIFNTNNSKLAELRITDANADNAILFIGSQGNLIVPGNLTVNGTTSTLNTETVTVEDNLIILNNNPNNVATSAYDSGMLIKRTSDFAGLYYSGQNTEFRLAATASDPGSSLAVTETDYLRLRVGGLTITNGTLSATHNSHTLGTIITTGGNVGIGKVPEYKLDVDGTLVATTITGANIATTRISTGDLRITNLYSTQLPSSSLSALFPKAAAVFKLNSGSVITTRSYNCTIAVAQDGFGNNTAKITFTNALTDFPIIATSLERIGTSDLVNIFTVDTSRFYLQYIADGTLRTITNNISFIAF